MECRRDLAMGILSVCLSVKRVHCDKTEEKSLQIFIPCRKIIQSSFMSRRMVGGGDPFYLQIFGQTARVGEREMAGRGKGREEEWRGRRRETPSRIGKVKRWQP